MKPTIAIIGGGAAGMMTALQLLTTTAKEIQVLLYESNAQLGTKVRISGGGRCNVTTGRTELADILACYPRGKNTLRPSMYAFPPTKVREFFEANGVSLKCEADLRVFPVSDDGDDIVGVFETYFRKDKRIHVFLKEKVSSVVKTEKGFEIHSTHHTQHVDTVVLTTGGQAYRHTGSQGDGYGFAEQLGHSITALAPSLHSFVCQESWYPDVAGISLPQVTLQCKGKHKHKITGPIIFTHRGISGPAVFALSSSSAFEEFSRTTPLALHLDFLPHYTQEALYSRLQQAQRTQGESLVKNISLEIPKALLHTILIQHQFPETPLKAWSDKHLHKLVLLLKDHVLQAVAKGKGDEFVTAGGVPAGEIYKETLESRQSSNLFFAGEILDIDGITGGFNLQCAWATGYTVGTTIAGRLQ